MGKHGFNGDVYILEERWHLFFGVTLGDVGNVDAASGVGSLLDDRVGRDIMFADVANKNIAWHNGVGEGRGDFATVVAQIHRYINGILWHRHEEHVLKRLPSLCGFGIGLPFLKQRGEGVAIDDFTRTMTANGDLSVTLYG